MIFELDKNLKIHLLVDLGSNLRLTHLSLSVLSVSPSLNCSSTEERRNNSCLSALDTLEGSESVLERDGIRVCMPGYRGGVKGYPLFERLTFEL